MSFKTFYMKVDVGEILLFNDSRHPAFPLSLINNYHYRKNAKNSIKCAPVGCVFRAPVLVIHSVPPLLGTLVLSNAIHYNYSATYSTFIKSVTFSGCRLSLGC